MKKSQVGHRGLVLLPVIGIILLTGCGGSSNSTGAVNSSSSGSNSGSSSGSSSGSAAYYQSGGSVIKTNQSYIAATDDESGVKVENSGSFTISSSTITIAATLLRWTTAAFTDLMRVFSLLPAARSRSLTVP